MNHNSTCVSAVIEEPSHIIGCTADDTCPQEQACRNGHCERVVCDCSPNSDCRIVNRKPVCTCREGYAGDPTVACYKIGCSIDEECPGTHACFNGQCKPVCNPLSCVSGAVCLGIQHKPVCECPPGTRGSPASGCRAAGCSSIDDCPSEMACFNGICKNPCSLANVCDPSQECKPFNHTVECVCPPGFEGTPGVACTKVDVVGCRLDTDCPLSEACLNGECKDPCKAFEPCAPTAICEVRPTEPYRTMICVCPPDTVGYAAEECLKPVIEEECHVERGFIKTENGTCICDPFRGYVVAPDGTCVCDREKGLIAGPSGTCVSVVVAGCRFDEDCPNNEYCNNTCRDPCPEKLCHPNSFCRATDHKAKCECIEGYEYLNPKDGCRSKARTDVPRPQIAVNCLADGVQVDVVVETPIEGLLYVKGHSKDPACRRILGSKDFGPIDFKVQTKLAFMLVRTLVGNCYFISRFDLILVALSSTMEWDLSS